MLFFPIELLNLGMYFCSQSGEREGEEYSRRAGGNRKLRGEPKGSAGTKVEIPVDEHNTTLPEENGLK